MIHDAITYTNYLSFFYVTPRNMSRLIFIHDIRQIVISDLRICPMITRRPHYSASNDFTALMLTLISSHIKVKKT